MQDSLIFFMKLIIHLFGMGHGFRLDSDRKLVKSISPTSYVVGVNLYCIVLVIFIEIPQDEARVS